MENALILGVVIGFSVGSFFIWGGLLFKGFVRVPAGHVLGVTRSGPDGGPGMAFVRSGATLVMPFFQRGALYPVRLTPISRRGMTITRGGVPAMVCDLETEVLPEEDDDGLMRYVQAFGGREVGEIHEMLGRVVEGGARVALGEFSAEAVQSDLVKVEQVVRDHLVEELLPLGLRVEALSLSVRPASGAARSRDASEFSLDGFRAD